MRKISILFVGIGLILGLHHNAHAQADAITVPNPGRIHIGDIGSLEAGAMIARTNDGAATFYNPAGLIRAIRPSVSGNASLYEFNKVTIGTGDDAEDATNFNIVPVYIGSNGFLGKDSGGSPKAAWGFSISTPLAWKSIASDEIESGIAGDDLLYNRYNSSSEIKSVVPSLAVAYAMSDNFSIGAAAHLIYTTEYQAGSEYYRDDSTGEFYNYSITQDSENLQGQLALGVSWQPIESVNIGVMAKSPSLNIYDNTSLSANYLTSSWDEFGNLVTESGYATNSNLDYRFKKPAEVGLGVAFVQPTFGIEADASYRMKVSSYNQYNGTLIFNHAYEDSTGFFDTAEEALPTGNMEEKDVVNCRVGGYAALSDTFKWHAGFFTDRSSLKDSGNYQKVNLYGVTTGLSRTDKNSSIGLGLAYTWSGDMKAETYDSNVGDYVMKDTDIQILGLILSGKYYF